MIQEISPVTYRNLAQIFESWTQKKPEQAALLAPNRSSLTYAELFKQLSGVGDTFQRLGLGPSARVAILAPNGPELALAFLCTATYATSAPLNPAYQKDELEFYLDDLDASALLIASTLSSPARDVAHARGIPVLELCSQPEQAAGCFSIEGKTGRSSVPAHTVLTDDVALLLHTSGTTARPKQVPLTQGNLCASIRHLQRSLALTPHDCCLNLMPLFHIHGLVGSLLASLGSGGSFVCPPGFSPTEVFAWIRMFQPTWYTAVPTIHQAMVVQAKTVSETIHPGSLRFIRSSSASLPPTVMADLEQLFGVPVIEAYGMTEAAHQMASNPLPPRPRKPGSVGLAAGPEIAVLDEETLEPLAEGAVGELAVRGPNMTAGYFENPSANESAFINGWFRTGDQGYIDSDGYVFITGRLKEMINRGGQKIAPREIDEVLMGHPDVVQAVAFATPHTSLGEDVAAAVIVHGESAANEAELRTFAFSHLADYKVPSRIVIVDAIPKGATGKLQRIGLSEQLASVLHTEFAAPKNAVEEALVQFWVDVLDIPSVGIADNFFWIGGDSITGAQLIDRVNATFQVDLPLASVFKYPTVESQAELVTNELLGEIEGLSDAELKLLNE